MGHASRHLHQEPGPISRSPSSGIRPAVRPPEAANDSDEELARELGLDVASPALPAPAPREVVSEEELALEDAVPLSSNAALALVFGCAVAVSGAFVAIFAAI